MLLAKIMQQLIRLQEVCSIINSDPDSPRKSAILPVDAPRIIEPAKFHIGNLQPLRKIIRRRPAFRIQHDIKVRFRHHQEFIKASALRDLTDRPDACKPQIILQLKFLHHRGEETEEIHRGADFLPLFQKGVQRLPHMHHRRPDPLPGKRVHIAGTHPHTACLFRLPAHAVPVRSQERIRTGRADHYQLRLFFRELRNLTDRLRDTFQMTSRNQVRLIHLQIKKPVPVLRHAADLRSISSAACRRYDQHNGVRNRQSCPLDTESLRTGRVICERCRTAEDKMLCHLI